MEEDVGVVDIAIVGGGICGLSLAVALHKKGVMKSIVIERSETLRSGGAGLAIWGNGWRALDHLGVGYKLRRPCSFITNRMIEVNLDTGKQINVPVSYGEARFVKRSDLMDALASELPESSIRYGSQVMSLIKLENEATTSLQLSNGSIIRAKVVVGCDGANSVIQGFLNLKPNKMSSLWGVRGFTSYENGHSFSPDFCRVKRGTTLWGRVAIDDKLVFWFLVLKLQPQGGTKPANYQKDQNLIKQISMEETNDFPAECSEIISTCDITTLSLVQLTYRPPWDLLFDSFHRKSTNNVTVAGDAMHVMFPFSGQGGSAAIEDAIVLARCLTTARGRDDDDRKKQVEEYVKERRMRLLWLSMETYLKGMMLEMSDVSSSSLFGFIVKMLIMVVLMVLFRDPIHYTLYDCGAL